MIIERTDRGAAAEPSTFSAARIAIGLLLPFIAIGLQLVLVPHGGRWPFLLVYPAVFLAAWIAGPWVGAASTVTGAALVACFPVEPSGSPLLAEGSNLIPLGLFLCTGLGFSWLQRTMRLSLKREQLIRAQSENDQKWAFATDAGQLGLWSWDLVRHKTTQSPIYRQMLGYVEDADWVGRERDFFDIVHPDDRAGIRQAVSEHLSGRTPAYRHEFRMRHRDGHFVWVEARGLVTQRDAHGKPLQMLGCHIDVSDRHARLEEIHASREKLQAALRGMADAVFVADRSYRLIEYNDAFVSFCRVADRAQMPQDLAGFAAILDSRGLDDSVIPIDQWPVPRALRGESGVYQRCIWRRLDTGEEWYSTTNYAPLTSTDGEVWGAVVVCSDITAQVRLEQSLAQAKEMADQANHAKSAFLASVSHDLRTPLNAVIGFSQLLLEGAAGEINDEQRRQLGMIKRAGEHQLCLVRDLLDLTTLEAGNMHIEPVPLSLRKALQQSSDHVAPMCRAKDLDLQLDLPDSGLRVSADPARLHQVLQNLLGNAIKFTDSGHVRVSSHILPQAVRVSIADSGVGIAPDRLGALFQPFTQIRTDRSRQYEGTGLGLSICKHLVERMGGDIGVESAPGVGSTFWFTLPTIC